MRRDSPLLAATLMVLTCPASAETAAFEPWAYCRPMAIPPVPEPAADGGLIAVDADRIDAERGGLSTFSGDVVIQRGERRMRGDRAVYDQPADTLTLIGNVRYQTDGTLLSGREATVQLEQDAGQIHDAEFRFAPSHAYGTAELIDIISPEFTHMEGATYTTCDPEERTWYLKAGRLDLDQATNTGEAYNVRLNIGPVPVFYTPYLNFPLAGRKSGFLAPSYGSSEVGGTDVALPYYWNIAPHRDATFTPRHIENRGAMLYSEFRYLNQASEGLINYEVLPDDSLYGDDRDYLYLTHRGRWRNWSADLLYQEVSDPEYFDDISRRQSDTSQTHLERRLNLNYQASWWSFKSRFQDYQTLTGSEPYQRLPQLALEARPPAGPGELNYELQSEWVHFAHDSREPTGTRLDLTPAVSLPLEGIAWFFTPKLALRHTQYQLDEGGDDDMTRTLPVASLDGGLFFERDLGLGGRPLLQTLEPRLYYLYVPYEDQDALPRFDTGSYDFTYAQLFRDDRFSGPDRVGDANQLTTAVTTRFLDAATGAELLSAGIGQIHYFRDREVTLTPSAEPEATASSEVVGELRAVPAPGWNIDASARYDPHESLTEVVTGRLRYHPGPGRHVSLSYRMRDPDLRQTDLAFFWPVMKHWNVLGRWNYDRLEEQDLDRVFGLEYQACCWSLRGVVRSTLNTTSLEQESSFMLLFELKGLAQVGDRLDSELERGILGY